MVRNSVDHGIESPEERVRAGKPPKGTIQLSSAQHGGRVWIEIADDGRGLNPERILNHARSRGMLPGNEPLSDAEIFSLIFQPGFSTAATVTEVSGRGVGLDVVKRHVDDLHGRIHINSELGRGAQFRIELPLTLAIIDGITVRVGEIRVVFPLASVVELVIPQTEDLTPIDGKHHLLRVSDDHLPLVKLADALQLPCSSQSIEESVVIVTQVDERRFGILVDEVLGMDQAVVKPLDSTFALIDRLGGHAQHTEGVGGATLLGDGTPAVIVDVNGLERVCFDVELRHACTKKSPAAKKPLTERAL